MRAPRLLLAIVSVATISLDAQIAIRPGEYEYEIDMNMAAAQEAGKAVLDGAGFQKDKRRDCLTPDDVKGDIATVLARGMEMGDECKMSNVKTVANKIAFTTTCVEDELRMTMNTEMTFVGDSFSGVTTSKDQEGRTTTMKVKARRIGDCPK